MTPLMCRYLKVYKYEYDKECDNDYGNKYEYEYDSVYGNEYW